MPRLDYRSHCPRNYALSFRRELIKGVNRRRAGAVTEGGCFHNSRPEEIKLFARSFLGVARENETGFGELGLRGVGVLSCD